MKKSLLLLLVLASFVTTSYPAARRGMDHVVVGSTIGRSIIVRDYEIPLNGDWRFRREVVALSPGAVGVIGAGYLSTNNHFNLLHSYQDSNDDVKWRNIEFDFATFTEIKSTQLKGEYGAYSGGTFQVATGLNRGRHYFVQSDFDVATQITNKNTGNPRGPQKQIFNNDSDFFPVAASLNTNYASQILLQRSTGIFFGDFRGLKGTGKPDNDLKRYRFNSDTVNISLGLRYNFRGTDTYTAATRDVKQEGSNYKTSVRLNLFNDEHIVLDSRLVSNYKNISVTNLNAAVFQTVYNYSFGDRRWALFVQPVSGNKGVTLSYEYNPGTLDILNKQTITSKKDLNQWNADITYGIYAIGFSDYDDDDY